MHGSSRHIGKGPCQVIGFTNSCDSKSSIVLGSVLATVSLVLGLSGKEIAYDLTGSDIWIQILIAIMLLLSVSSIILGIVNILNSVKARLNPSEYGDDSVSIYFGKIAKLSLEDYRESVRCRNEQSYVSDLIAQIHTCSIICQHKYEHYNEGLRYSVIGIGLMIVTSVITLLI